MGLSVLVFSSGFLQADVVQTKRLESPVIS
jgi:hypothetical protein